MSDPQPRRVLRQRAVLEMTGVTDVTLWRWEREGRFPKRFKLSENGRGVGWWQDEIQHWQRARDESRNAPQPEAA